MAQYERKRGAWAVVTPKGQVIIENSEVKALREAVEIGGKVTFVEWGNTVGAPTAEAKPTAKPDVPASKTDAPEF